MAYRQGLLRIGHIQRATKPARAYFLRQGCKIDQAASRDIDYDRPVLKQAQSFAVQEMLCLFRCCCRHHQHGAELQYSLERIELHRHFTRQLPGGVWIINSPSEVEPAQHLDQCPPYPTEP